MFSGFLPLQELGKEVKNPEIYCTRDQIINFPSRKYVYTEVCTESPGHANSNPTWCTLPSESDLIESDLSALSR